MGSTRIETSTWHANDERIGRSHDEGMNDMTNTHWHCATGIAGYGPEGEISDTCTSLTQLADSLVWHLECIADSERETADSLADSDDYRGAWDALKSSEAAGTLALNLSNKRASAPLYADDPKLWPEAIERIVDSNLPFDFRDGNSRLYAWSCVEAECLEGEDEEVI